MVLSGYYNKENKVAIIVKKVVENPVMEIRENMTILKTSDGEVVGINIFGELETKSHILDLNQFESEIKEIFGCDTIENPFIYGKIKSYEKHPKSEKLKICQVDLGYETVQIICGAKNCTDNQVAVVARVGAVMPTGLEIKPSQLIGVDSAGMLCSYAELGYEIEGASGIALFEVGEKEIGSKFI